MNRYHVPLTAEPHHAGTEANELAPDITTTIEMLQNEEVPGYVPLPVRIQ